MKYLGIPKLKRMFQYVSVMFQLCIRSPPSNHIIRALSYLILKMIQKIKKNIINKIIKKHTTHNDNKKNIFLFDVFFEVVFQLEKS